MESSATQSAAFTEAIDLLIVNGPMNRAALAEQARWARSTASRVVNQLISDGVVIETDAVPTGDRGRPSRTLMLNPDSGSVIGVDCGFRHVRAVIADASQGIRGSAVRALEVDYSPSEGMRTARDLVDELVTTSGLRLESLRGVGVAVPAPLHRSVVTKSSMIPTWSGRNVAEDLGKLLRLPVWADNDSKLAAQAEMSRGVGQRYENFLFFKLHSGTGGAAIINRRVVDGATGSAGEFGHSSLDPSGPVCRCGNRGCLEVYAGVPAILDALRLARGPAITLREATHLLDTHDLAAERVFREAAARVGQAAGALCNALNPEAVIIGGALARAFDGLLPEVLRGVRQFSLPVNHGVDVVTSQLGPEASAIGAVRLAFSQLARHWSSAAT